MKKNLLWKFTYYLINSATYIKKIFYIEFLLKIRDERKFDSQEELVKQIKKDEEVCIELTNSSKEKYEV